MMRATLLFLILGLGVAPFFSIAQAAQCDGIDPLCPAVYEDNWNFNYQSGDNQVNPKVGALQGSPQSAVGDFCGHVQPQPYPEGCTASGVTCPSSYTPGSFNSSGSAYNSGSVKAQYVVTKSGNYCGYVGTKTISGSIKGTNLGKMYKCINPDYPIGPDAQHMCHKVTCQKAGTLYQPSIYNPLGPSSLCLNMPDTGSQCGYTYQGMANNTPLYTATGESCSCSPEQQSAGACGTHSPYDPEKDGNCYRMNDGVLACPADPAERCHVAGTTNGVPTTVCDAGCGYVGSGDSEQFICLTNDKPEACAPGDSRPLCAEKPPGTCPNGALTCDGNSQYPTCQQNDTRPECAGVPVGTCPEGKTCGEYVPENPDMASTNQRLDKIAENTKGVWDILKKWDQAKPTDEDRNGASQTAEQMYNDKLSEAESEYANAGEGEKDAHLGEIASQQPAYVAAVEALLPQPQACQPLRLTVPGFSYDYDWCNLAALFRAFAEWTIMISLAWYIWSDIREQAKRTV